MKNFIHTFLPHYILLAPAIFLFTYSTAQIQRPPRCFSDTLPSGKIVVAEGLYPDTLKSMDGSDSIVSFLVRVTAVDTTVSIAGGQITSNHPFRPMWGPTYEWLDCDDNFRVVGSGKVFMAPKNGNYALKISEEYCLGYITQCHAITQVGLSSLSLPAFRIYPNPGYGQYVLDFGQNAPESVTILDLNGRLVTRLEITETGLVSFQFDAAPGVYFVTISAEGREYRQKLIHQR